MLLTILVATYLQRWLVVGWALNPRLCSAVILENQQKLVRYFRQKQKEPAVLASAEHFISTSSSAAMVWLWYEEGKRGTWYHHCYSTLFISLFCHCIWIKSRFAPQNPRSHWNIVMQLTLDVCLSDLTLWTLFGWLILSADGLWTAICSWGDLGVSHLSWRKFVYVL